LKLAVLSKVDDFVTFWNVEVFAYFLESKSSFEIFYFLESRK